MSQTSRHGPAGLVSWSASPGGLYWSAPRLWIRYAHPARQERRGVPLPGAPYTSQQACLARTTTRAAVLERLWPKEGRMGRAAGRASDLLFLPDHCVIGYGTLEERGLPTQSMRWKLAVVATWRFVRQAGCRRERGSREKGALWQRGAPLSSWYVFNEPRPPANQAMGGSDWRRCRRPC